MASGLQCPGCGHVHPAGLPEIARGDATFRCYGCYRTLSVPDGWTGRPTPRPSGREMTVTRDAPPGAGTRDARSSRLAGRGGAGALTGPPSADLPTQMVPEATPDGGPHQPGAPAGSWAAGTAAPPASWTTGAPSRTGAPVPLPGGSGGAPGPAGLTLGGRKGATPLGWVAPRRSGTPVPAAIRAGVWAGAFAVGLAMTAFILRKMGILDVNRVIDLYAGTGPGRFGVLLLMLPMWALLSATIAHLALEFLAKRRAPRPAARPANTSSPG